MESRTEFEGRIHFFEYFSLEKFEEYKCNIDVDHYAMLYNIQLASSLNKIDSYNIINTPKKFHLHLNFALICHLLSSIMHLMLSTFTVLY
jgi:hypothetical protein